MKNQTLSPTKALTTLAVLKPKERGAVGPLSPWTLGAATYRIGLTCLHLAGLTSSKRSTAAINDFCLARLAMSTIDP